MCIRVIFRKLLNKIKYIHYKSIFFICLITTKRSICLIAIKRLAVSAFFPIIEGGMSFMYKNKIVVNKVSTKTFVCQKSVVSFREIGL